MKKLMLFLMLALVGFSVVGCDSNNDNDVNIELLELREQREELLDYIEKLERETSELKGNLVTIQESQGQFEVEIIDIIEKNGYIVKKSDKYVVGAIWVMITEDTIYKLGDTVIVTWFGKEICTPLIEYVDKIMDGYGWNGSEWVNIK